MQEDSPAVNQDGSHDPFCRCSTCAPQVRHLRFECGAVSPSFKGSFEAWVRENVKALKGFALAHRRQDGRYRVISYDLDGQSLSPRMPDGRRSPCLTCPCPKEAGRREVDAKRVDLRGIRRIVVTCYPEEVSAGATRKVAFATPDVARATPRVAGLHGAGQCEKIEHGGRTGYLHGPEDDSPYDVDGLKYCGRCHCWIPPAYSMSESTAPEGHKEE